MDRTIPLNNVKVNIEDILYVCKWKYAQGHIQRLTGNRPPKKTYGRNDRVVLYKDSNGRLGSMETINGIKTVKELKEFLNSFDELEIKGE